MKNYSMLPKTPPEEVRTRYHQLKLDMGDYIAHESNPENVMLPQGIRQKADIQNEIEELDKQYPYFTFAKDL